MRFSAQPFVPSFVHRILSRLADAQADEPDPWYRDDLKIARLTVFHAARGDAVYCSPDVLACYEVLGVHPAKVWPRIQAQRTALLGPSDAPPKKPAQSVKLWFEKTNAARAINSRGAMHQGSPRTTISVPMAAPSIAALYPNSDAPSSAKTRQFTLDELANVVRYSGAPVPIRNLTLAALSARGPWPRQNGPATTVLCVAIRGMAIEAGVWDRTIQRRIKRAKHLGFWRQTHSANSWLPCQKCGTERSASKCDKCGHRGSAKDVKEFHRPFTYEIDVQAFATAPRPREIQSVDWRTYAEYKAAAKRGEHPNVTEMPSRKPAQPAPPVSDPPPTKAAPVKQPAATTEERKPLVITRDVRMAIAGCYLNARKQGKDEEAAIAEACESLSSERFYLAASEVRLQLKIWQSKHGSLDPPPAPRAESLSCPKCHTYLVQNRGPGPRLICPKCSSG